MNLAGIPPFSGFLGKVGLVEAGTADGTVLAYLLIAGGLATSLLTLYAVVKAWNKAFWQEAPGPLVDRGMPRGMVASAGALVAVGLAITVVAGPLYRYTDQTAVELRERSPYVVAVLPDGLRGTGQSADLAEDGDVPEPEVAP